MNHDQSVTARKPAPSRAYEQHLFKPQDEFRPARRAKRSPLPSARELDAAIERKYGCRPYWEDMSR